VCNTGKNPLKIIWNNYTLKLVVLSCGQVYCDQILIPYYVTTALTPF